MLDLETMGNKSNAAIVSIGAIEFNLDTGVEASIFYERIDLQSCIDRGLKIDASTLYWWLKQNEEARLELAKGGIDLYEALGEFSSWIYQCNTRCGKSKSTKLWGNGARFDIGLLEDAYVACGYHEMPWLHYNELDLRTLVYFAPQIKDEVRNNFKGVAHNPIDDCRVQIKYATRIWNKMKNNG